jgi:hypothetical protein
MASRPTDLGSKKIPDWRKQILEGVQREETKTRRKTITNHKGDVPVP